MTEYFDQRRDLRTQYLIGRQDEAFNMYKALIEVLGHVGILASCHAIHDDPVAHAHGALNCSRLAAEGSVA